MARRKYKIAPWRLALLIQNLPKEELIKVSASTLAAWFGCCESRIQQLIKQRFGVPLQAIQIKARMELIKRRLEASLEPIGKIARANGYNCTQRFNALFKEQTGLTPTQWRKQRHEAILKDYFSKLSPNCLQTGVDPHETRINIE